MYSNCVTLRSSSPLQTTNSNELLEGDISFEDNFHSDGNIIEEEIYMNDEMSLEPNISEDCCESQEFPQCDSEYLRDGVDDTYTENTSVISEGDYCDSNAKTMMDDRLTNYVELIETVDEPDEPEYLLQQLSQESMQSETTSNEMYKNFSRDDLIEHLTAAQTRIKELETKLDNIQKVMVQNLNNFNKVLIS